MQRFLSFDPIKLRSGDFNFYRYVGSDPVNRVDPSGLWFWETDSNTSMSTEDAKAAVDKTRGYGSVFDEAGHSIGEKGVDILTKSSCDKYNAIVDIVGKEKANKMYPCKPKKPKSQIETADESAQKAKDKAAQAHYCNCVSGSGSLPDSVCTADVNSNDEFNGAVWDKNCSR